MPLRGERREAGRRGEEMDGEEWGKGRRGGGKTREEEIYEGKGRIDVTRRGEGSRDCKGKRKVGMREKGGGQMGGGGEGGE